MRGTWRATMVLAAAITGAAAVRAGAATPPPRLINPGPWFSEREAPAGALAPGRRAMTALDLLIAPDGSVTTCGIARSSASALLEDHACTLMLRNARYEVGDAGVARTKREFLIWETSRAASNAGASKAAAAIKRAGSATWITTDDLAVVDLARDQVVVSNVELAIDPAGKVAGCSATLPSERPDLDARVCLLLSQRARYKAAHDAAGKPIDGVDWVTIRWQVPRDR